MRTLAGMMGVAVLAASFLTCAQAADPARTATLEATDRPTAEVVAELSEQLGLQIGLLGPCAGQVTVDVQEAKADEAVAALATGLKASWVRVYLLESAPPPVPYTPDQLLAGLQHQRDRWFESLTELQRGALVASFLTDPPPGAPPKPGAGVAPLPAGTTPQPDNTNFLDMQRFDTVRQLIMPGRTDTVTVNVKAQPLPQALFALMTASGFMIAAGNDLAGDITVQAEQQPLEQVLDEVADQAQAQWRRVYLLSVPRPMSEAELNQMIESQLSNRLASYWARPPEERAREVDKWVNRLNAWGALARQPATNGRENMLARGLKQFGPRVMTWMVQYTAGLSREQRAELKPLLQALVKAVGQ